LRQNCAVIACKHLQMLFALPRIQGGLRGSKQAAIAL
jgi:hypothetical protein